MAAVKLAFTWLGVRKTLAPPTHRAITLDCSGSLLRAIENFSAVVMRLTHLKAPDIDAWVSRIVIAGLGLGVVNSGSLGSYRT